MKNSWYTFRSGLLLLLAVGAAHCKEKAATPVATAAETAISVKLQPVTDTVYAPVLRYSGKIASASEANLSFKTGGIISRMYVKEGDAVVRGQLLAMLDLTEINAQVQQAVQGAEKAQREVTRAKNLYQDTVATLEQYQNATTQHQVANEQLRIARFNQQYAQIRATGPGTILRKLMNEGELAAPGAPVFYINGNAGNDWVMRFGVSDKDWAVLHKGNRGLVSLDAYPLKTFEGIVSQIAGGADPANGTYEVEVKVLPGAARFAPGLFARVELQPTERQSVTLVPIEALIEADGKKGFVYTVNPDGKTVQRHAVTIAFLEKDKAAIVSGLDGVTQVITEGVGYLTEQSVVRIVQ